MDKILIGAFVDYDMCILQLNRQGFIFIGENVYINKTTREVAQIYTYKDNSASILFGKY